jgi:tyrosinase
MQTPWGVHAGGHFTIGGDPGGVSFSTPTTIPSSVKLTFLSLLQDVFVSPGDPAFFLHHGMIDRVWWIWQLQDLETRLTAVAGTVAGGGNRAGSLRDKVHLGITGPEVELGSLLNTIGGKGGEFCYIYM